MADDEDEYVSVGEPIPRLKSVTAGAGRSLNLVWEDGNTATIDLTPHFSRHRVFAPLADDTLFSTVQLDDLGWGIFWPDAPDAAVPTTTLQDLERGTYPD